MKTDKTIMVVDDTAENLKVISNILKNYYKVKVVNDGKKALEFLEKSDIPDLILLDIMMPHMDGYEVIKILKENPKTNNIPVIFLTAMSESKDEEKGLMLGAADYITKPISAPVLLARVKTQLEVKEYEDFLRDKNSFLELEVQKRTKEINAIQSVTILALTSLAETRDSDTGNHIRRTQFYVKTLAELLKDHPQFRDYLKDETIETLFKSAPLHDIGKVGIPDRILLKPGKLTDEEFTLMKEHTILGKDAIEHAELQFGMEVDFLKTAKDIAYYHHEKWDGSGYPKGLKEDDIPISARLMAIADVYDALISKRVYKDGMPHEKAVGIIKTERGKHFDPIICDAFIQNHEAFDQIAQSFSDTTEDLKKKAEQMKKLSNVE